MQTESTRQADWVLVPCVDTTGLYGGVTNAAALAASSTAAIADLLSIPSPPGFYDRELASVDTSPLGHYLCLQAQGADVFLSFGSTFASMTATMVGSASVTTPGNGYTATPTVTFSGGSASTQATAMAVISSAGTLMGIVMLTPGAGYTGTPTVTISAPGGGGTTATATANLGSPPSATQQNTVSATTGKITMLGNVTIWIPSGQTLQCKLPTGSKGHPIGANSPWRFVGYVTATSAATLRVWQSSP